MRTLVAIMVLHGVVPGVGALTMGLAGAATAREQTVALHCEREDGHSGSEQGCGATVHVCDCCAPDTVVGSAPSIVRGLEPVSRLMSRAERQLARREPDRPFRPPIC